MMREVQILSIPTIFDVAATLLMNIGLLDVTASVFQMMRGTEMLFAALFAYFFLNRMLNKNHYLGITCCIVRTQAHLLPCLPTRAPMDMLEYGDLSQAFCLSLSLLCFMLQCPPRVLLYTLYRSTNYLLDICDAVAAVLLPMWL